MHPQRTAAGKKKTRSKAKDPPSLPIEDSDGDTTPTQDNRKDTKNGNDTDTTITSKINDVVSISLAKDIQQATNTFNDNALTDDCANPHSAKAIHS